MENNKEKAPAQYLRARESHSTMVKLDKLLELMESLRLSVSVEGENILLHDGDFPGRTFIFVDTDSGRPNECYEFPPTCEFYLRFENPAYTTFQEQERVKWQQELERRNIAKKEEEEKRKVELAKSRLKQAQNAKEFAEEQLQKALSEMEKISAE